MAAKAGALELLLRGKNMFIYSLPKQALNSLRRKLAFFAFAAILVFPMMNIPLPSSHAQSVGNKWKVEMTIEEQSILVDVSETVTGEVELVKDPASGALILKGTGEGTWTYRHHEKEDQCPALSGDGTFEVTFSGHVQLGLAGDEPVFVALQAAPGGDQFGGEIGRYVRSESVTCHDEDTTWEESRIIAPLIIGPLGKTLEEFIEGVTIVQDQGAYGSVKITAKIMPPDVVFRVYGTVKDSRGNPMQESKVVAGDLAKIGEDGDLFLRKLSDSKPDFEDETTTSDTTAEYELELTRPAAELHLELAVVSVLWYKGDGVFAVTNGDEVAGRYIPVYLGLCVDHVGEGCVEWRQTADGFEAEVNFVYGSDADRTASFMEMEDWEMGSTGSINQLMEDAGVIYYNSYRAMKYFESLSSVDVALNPVTIQVNHQKDSCPESGAYYEGSRRRDGNYLSFGDLGSHLEKDVATGSSIFICDADSRSNYPDAPINREWHELGHYLHYNMYYGRTSDRQTSHAGYINDVTNVSFVEGFAEFIAIVINEHYQHRSPPYVYPIGRGSWSLESDYKVWGGSVRSVLDNGTMRIITTLKSSQDEERAVAGILWDLHDSGEETNPKHFLGTGPDGRNYWAATSEIYPDSKDTVTLPADQVMQVISQKEPRTLVELYDAFQGTVPDSQLAMIFVNHAAFNDVAKRDLVHGLSGEAVGPTGHTPEREVRRSPAPELPGSNIMVNDNATFIVNFVHEEPFSHYDYSYRVEMAANQGAYFEMPPAYYPSQAIFDLVSSDGRILMANATKVDSDEYWAYIDSNPDQNAIFKRISVDSDPGAVVAPVSSGNNQSGVPPGQPLPPPQAGGGGGGGGCLIATAAFGSELTPQVQFLRSFRDNHILSTATGSSFMTVFNSWYYSFSPQVADYERQQPWLQQIVRVAIYPLLAILHGAEKAYAVIPGEFGSISAGLAASSLIGAVYFSPAALLIKQVRRNRIDYRIAVLAIAGFLISVLVALLINSAGALMATTAGLIVTTVAISAVYAAKGILRIIGFWRR